MWGFCFLIVFLFCGALADIPKFKCPLDSKFDGCFKSFFAKALQFVAAHGIREYSIPVLDPLRVSVKSKQHVNTDLISGDVTINGIVVKGLKGLQLSKFRTNAAQVTASTPLSVEVEVFIPHLVVEARWEDANLKTQFDELVARSGTLTVTIDNVKASASVKVKNVWTSPEVTQIKLSKPNIGRVQIDATTVITSDSDLNAAVLEMANDAWRDAYDKLYPGVASKVETTSKDYINRLIKKQLATG